MPHYNETKSFACLRQEIVGKKKEGKCSRVNELVASHTRKSKKDEIKKLKKQRDKGLNDKTDEQIFQDVLAMIHMVLIEVKKKADQLVEKARKYAENARTEAEKAKKK
ncbi:Adenylate cyclase [Bienertia sinuspersici]